MLSYALWRVPGIMHFQALTFIVMRLNTYTGVIQVYTQVCYTYTLHYNKA